MKMIAIQINIQKKDIELKMLELEREENAISDSKLDIEYSNNSDNGYIAKVSQKQFDENFMNLVDQFYLKSIDKNEINKLLIQDLLQQNRPFTDVFIFYLRIFRR